MLKLVEMDTTPEADLDLESAFASMAEKSDVDSVVTGPSIESDTFAGDVDTENNTGEKRKVKLQVKVRTTVRQKQMVVLLN